MYALKVCTCAFLHVEVKGQLAGLGSLLPSYVSREQTHQTWQEGPFPSRPTHWPENNSIFIIGL